MDSPCNEHFFFKSKVSVAVSLHLEIADLSSEN